MKDNKVFPDWQGIVYGLLTTAYDNEMISQPGTLDTFLWHSQVAKLPQVVLGLPLNWESFNKTARSMIHRLIIRKQINMEHILAIDIIVKTS